jgi:hypothetical protein
MEITRSSIDTGKDQPDWFTGDVYVDPIASPSDTSRVGGGLVHFTPGAPTGSHQPRAPLRPRNDEHLVSEQGRRHHRRGSGIGLGTPRAFAQAGAAVALVDLNQEAAQAEAQELNGSGHPPVRRCRCGAGGRHG